MSTHGKFYQDSRHWSDDIFKYICKPYEFPFLNVTPLDPEILLGIGTGKYYDMQHAIDYAGIMQNPDGTHVNTFVQYRNRTFESSISKSGEKYNDCTLRYRRDFSTRKGEQESEVYKLMRTIDQHKNCNFFLIYNIMQSYDESIDLSQLSSGDQRLMTDRMVVLDLKKVVDLLRQGKMVIDENSRTSRYKDGVMYLGVNGNADASSSFVVFDVGQLCKYFPETVYYEKGYRQIDGFVPQIFPAQRAFVDGRKNERGLIYDRERLYQLDHETADRICGALYHYIVNADKTGPRKRLLDLGVMTKDAIPKPKHTVVVPSHVDIPIRNSRSQIEFSL